MPANDPYRVPFVCNRALASALHDVGAFCVSFIYETIKHWSNMRICPQRTARHFLAIDEEA